MANPKYPVVVHLELQISTEIVSVRLAEVSLKGGLLVVVIRDREIGLGYRLLADIDTR